jgi:hypothetical protein
MRVPERDLPPAADVHPQYLWIWRCWQRLSPDRPWIGGGMGPAQPGNIPWMTLRAWAEAYDLSEGEFALLDQCVRAMDGVFRTWIGKQNVPPS